MKTLILAKRNQPLTKPFEDKAKNPIFIRLEYSGKEFELIKDGCLRAIPYNQGDQRWCIETIDNWVYIMRSLNKSVVFKIHFIKKDNVYVSDKAYMVWKKIEEDDRDSFIRINNYYNSWMFFLIENLIFDNPFAFFDDVGAGTKIDFNGIHGFSHWRNVNRFGKIMANNNGADTKVIYFFSVLHDYYRENEDEDFGHGQRAVNKCDYFPEYLNEKQREILKFAVKNHNLPLMK